jgi:hypothetical protein
VTHASSFGSAMRVAARIAARRRSFISTTSFQDPGAARDWLKILNCFVKGAIFRRVPSFSLQHPLDTYVKKKNLKSEDTKMTRKTNVATVKVRRGRDLNTGKGWRLVAPGGRRAFKAALLKKLNVGHERLAIFRVLP